MKKITFILAILLSIASNAQCFEYLSGGTAHYTAKKSDGTIWGWGTASFGQQCTGTSSTPILTPTQLCSANDWANVFGGSGRTFAIKNDGTLWGTGDNGGGALGVNSTTIYFYTFTQVGTANNWVKISNAGSHTLGLQANGTLWGWGQNSSGALGGASSQQYVRTPVQIGTATDWADVYTAGVFASLALKTNGTLWGWGYNGTGIPCGPSPSSGVGTPTQIGTANDWAKISVGEAHVLALKTNGTLWAWGNGGNGETGDGLLPSYFRNAPVQVGTDTWLFVAAAGSSSYGIKSDGTLWAWGLNDNNNQLGLNNNINQFAPVMISAATDWVKIYTCVNAVQHATFAQKSDGSLWVWGSNVAGAYGNGTTVSSGVPTPNPSLCVATLETESFIKEPFTLSPNPAKEETTLYFGTALDQIDLSLFDAMGRRVYNQHYAEAVSNIKIPLSSLERGVYFVVVKQNNQVISSKKISKE